MEFFEPREIFRDIALIPAEVEVVGANLRRLDEGIVRGEHGDVRHDRGAGRIERCGKLLELLVGGDDLVRDAAQSDLVGERPADDARVVVVLGDELLHLREDIAAAIGHALGDVGNFRPNDEAKLIAQFIEIVVVLIVGKADGVSAELQDEGDIFLVLLLADGVALACSVLMAGYAAQRVDVPVQEEALVGVEGDGAEAEGVGKGVDGLSPLYKRCRESIEVGIGDAVPKVRGCDFKGLLPHRRLLGGDDVPLAVGYFPQNGAAVGV